MLKVCISCWKSYNSAGYQMLAEMEKLFKIIECRYGTRDQIIYFHCLLRIYLRCNIIWGSTRCMKKSNPLHFQVEINTDKTHTVRERWIRKIDSMYMCVFIRRKIIICLLSGATLSVQSLKPSNSQKHQEEGFQATQKRKEKT